MNEQQILRARQFAATCAYMGWSLDESVKALQEDYGMEADEARELMNEELRKRQEVDIADTHDDIAEGDL